MQCIDFRKIAYLFMTSQEDSGTRREILKQALYFARLLLSLHRHSSQANYDLHKEAFFGSVPRNRNLENFTQADGENQSLSVFCIRSWRSARCVLLCIQKHGAMFSVFILQGFSRCPVSMMPRTRSRASFCVTMQIEKHQ